jgi:hypothetical protein
MEIGMEEKSVGLINENSNLNLYDNVFDSLLYSPLLIEECKKIALYCRFVEGNALLNGKDKINKKKQAVSQTNNQYQ